MKKVISMLIVIIMACTLFVPAYAADKAVGSNIALSASSGSVTVKNASGSSLAVRAGMKLSNGYSVSAGTKSYAYITLDSTKAVKLDSSSSAQVKASGRQLEVKLTKGKLYFNVDAPLASSERLNISTSTMVTGIRGSYGWVTEDEMGLLHGHVTVTCKAYRSSETVVFDIKGGEGVRLTTDAQSGAQTFEKITLKEEDIPYFVISELRKNTGLQGMIRKDVPTLDVDKILALEEIKGEEDAALEQTLTDEINEKLGRLFTNSAKNSSTQVFNTVSYGSGGGNGQKKN
ncbi:MAG: FecR domain-containing protein [Clostridia bacterium]|nr:FecR domain-containing protein [Clostridia bacterium]